MNFRVLAIPLIILSQLTPSKVLAERNWLLCQTPTPPRPEVTTTLDETTPIEFSADKVISEEDGISVFSGNVVMERGPQRLETDELQYSKPNRKVTVEHGLNYTHADSGIELSADYAELYVDDERSEFSNTHFWFKYDHARGSAKRIESESSELYTLHNVLYTTCDPGNQDWHMTAKKIKLNYETNDGTARGVIIRFKKVPVFYTPYLWFPVKDERKSGVLVPKIGNSDRTGVDIAVPYYFNIAPNRDATVTPRYMGKRGLQMNGQLRYLNPNNNGEVNAEYLNDTDAHETRHLFALDHSSSLSRSWSANINLTDVSDNDYFKDLGDSLSVSSTTQLLRRADLRYQQSEWDFLTRIEDYQTLTDPLDEPYKRLPQLLLKRGFTNQGNGFDFNVRGEAVRFDRDQGVTGDRLDVIFGIERPIVGASYFVKPELKLRSTRYSLDDTQPTADDSPNRDLPVFSLDSGVIFERRSKKGHLQTLEPRFYYLYVPFRNQDDIPDFDSSELDFTFEQLFRDNRFSGSDRVGDANQLSLALTTRTFKIDAEHESFRASIGQIVYFRDRDVTLPGQPRDTSNSSDYAAELFYRFNKQWSISYHLLWDPDEDQTDRNTTRLRYQGNNNRIVNLTHRFRRDVLEQADFAFSLPVHRRWNLVGRWNYDLRNDEDLEVMAGFEYESCCWKIRFVARRYLIDLDEYNSGAFVQLVLKGFTRLGNSVDSLLEKGILGYEDED